MLIRVIPFNFPFLPVLARYILKNHSSALPDLSSILIVFPSQRNKFYFREYLLSNSKRGGIIPPQLFTIEELYIYLLERMGGNRARIAEEIERNAILKEAVDEIKAKHLRELPFIKFISIGNRLLQFFDELKNYNFTIEEIQAMEETLHFPAKYTDEELPILKKVQTRYYEILKSRSLTDPVSSYLSVATNFSPEYLKEFEYIYFAGFLAFTFTDASLVKKILINLPSELILHSEKEKLQDSSLTNIFYHHWKILNLLQATSENVEILPGLPSEEVSITSIHIQKSRDIIDEVSYILHTLSHTLKRYLPHRTGIVVGDESFYLPLTDALEKFNIGYNLSMGIPFTHTPLYSFLRSAYELIDSDLHATQLFTFLKHPLIKGIESPLYSPERTTACESEGKERVSFRPLIYELDRRMRERNVSYFDENLKDSRNEILVDFILGIVEELNRNDPFPEYVRNVRGMLHKLLNLNEQFFKNNADTAGRLMEELIKVENTSIPEALFSSGKDKLRFLIKVLEGVSFRQFGDFLNGIQVIGVLESRNLDFDCIVIPSCNEGIFPRRSEKDLFLPANLRKEAGLPYYKEREALYSYYFHQLITGKKEVYISYRSEEDGELTLRSRWIEELLYTKKRSFVVREETSKNLTNIFVTGRLRREAILKGTAKEGAVINTLKDMSFSPSSLKTYRECSYKFYLSYILKLKEPVLIQEEFDHALWGAIIHNSLKRLYSDFYPEGYGMEEKTQVMEILFRIGEEEFRNVYPHPKASLYFEWGLYKRRLQGFIEKEISRFREGFKPVKLEEQLNPYILNIGNGLRVKLLGIPDRIDQRGEKFYVLDYKMTTRPQVKGYRIDEEFTEFQLPLYALIFTEGITEAIGGLIYYHLDDNRQRFLTLDILEREGENYLERFKEEILLPTLQEIFNKSLPFSLTENFDTCQRCPYIDHCRRRL